MGSEVDVRPRSPAKNMDHTSSPCRDGAGKAAWCQFCHRQPPSGGLEQLRQLEVVLPDYEHTVCAFEPLQGGAFNVSIKLKVTAEEEAKTWLSAFQASSKTTWRVKKTYPVTEDKARHNKYRVDLRCQRKQHNPLSKKNTFCPAVLYLVLKKDSFSQKRKSRSMDPHYQNQLYLHVNIQSKHNHEVNCSEHHDVSRETIEKLQHLFKSGHSPSSALTTIKHDLQEELGKSYVFASADRSICPDLQFCYRLYYKIFKQGYGEASGDEMLLSLRHKIDSYNHEQGEECAKMSFNENQISIALCSPLMKRVHRNIKQSGEMMFLDSSGNCGRLNSRIFLLLTHHSVPGGVPLGVFITSSESERNIRDGLELLKAILPQEAFFGRGKLGPQVVVSDDCKALRQAVKLTFPESRLILCIFHLLQATRRWLWDGHHGIHKNDRQHLLKMFGQLVYAKNPADLETYYNKALQDLIVAKYGQFKIHLEDVFEKRDLWALSLRSHLPTDGNRTNSFVESAVRALKDQIFHRLKAFNITQVVDFITTRLEAYYSRRLNSSPDISASEKKLFYHIATGQSKVPDQCCVGLKQEGSEIPAPDPSDEMTSPLILPESPPANEGSACSVDPVLLTKQREDAEMDLRSMFEDLLEKLETDDSFIIPIQAFTSSFNRISTDSDLISSLHTFGKTHTKSSTAKTLRSGLQTSTGTGEQPTAVARRKTPLGGRRCLITGRPTKKSRVEHSYV